SSFEVIDTLLSDESSDADPGTPRIDQLQETQKVPRLSQARSKPNFPSSVPTEQNLSTRKLQDAVKSATVSSHSSSVGGSVIAPVVTGGTAAPKPKSVLKKPSFKKIALNCHVD